MLFQSNNIQVLLVCLHFLEIFLIPRYLSNIQDLISKEQPFHIILAILIKLRTIMVPSLFNQIYKNIKYFIFFEN